MTAASAATVDVLCLPLFQYPLDTVLTIVLTQSLTIAAAAVDVLWTSGALYDDAEHDRLAKAEATRLQKLKADPELPLVYLDVAIKGEKVGRIEMVLFTKEAPRAAENFRQLCTGEERA